MSRSHRQPSIEPADVAIAGELTSLGKATAWINSSPLTEENIKGKVVLVQFWTFTCINWLRTLPYIRAWAERYKNSGLVVIGAHTPEFPFEHDLVSVRRAVADMKVDYPVAVDSDYAIWRGFNNQYWPALYLFDAKGQARYHQFGEGEYDATEGKIQELLGESGARLADRRLTPVEGRGIEAPADWADLKSAENYVGYERTQNFASPGGSLPDRPHAYSLPRDLRLSQWALEGDWNVHKNSIALDAAGGRIAANFHGRDLNLVMGPPNNARPVRFRVSLDGRPPATSHGVDIDAQGNGVAKEQRLYQLIRQPTPIVDRVFQIEFLEPGVEAFVFTFG